MVHTKRSLQDIGKVFPLDPIPKSLTWTIWPIPIPEEFNWWIFNGPNMERHLIMFSHYLGYRIELPYEYALGHQDDGTYKLKKQIIIKGPRVYPVPIQ